MVAIQLSDMYQVREIGIIHGLIFDRDRVIGLKAPLCIMVPNTNKPGYQSVANISVRQTEGRFSMEAIFLHPTIVLMAILSLKYITRNQAKC